MHCPSKCCSGTLQFERHMYDTMRARWSYKCYFLLVFLGHEDLMLTRVGIKKGEQVAAGSGVHNLVNPWQREGVLPECFMYASEVNTKPPLTICLANNHWVC